MVDRRWWKGMDGGNGIFRRSRKRLRRFATDGCGPPCHVLEIGDMTHRVGISLIEVLVAAVLLAIGVAGTLSALTTAMRLRIGAEAHESAVERADARLGWFARGSCPAQDTAVQLDDSSGVRERWRVGADSTGARLTGYAEVPTFGGRRRFAVEARRACP